MTAFFVASRNDARDKYATLSDTVARQHWVLYSFQDVDNNQFATMDYKEGISVAATFGSAKWFLAEKKWLSGRQIPQRYPTPC